MPINPSTIKTPIDPTDLRFKPMLQKLQGNILKSHGRDYATHIFFRFTGDQAAARRLVGSLSKLVTSAAEQKAQAAAHKAHGTEALFGALMLSAKGLKHLGFPLPPAFGDAKLAPATSVPVSFAQPMKAAARVLGDDPGIWDKGYQAGDIDGALLLAAGQAMAPFDADAIPTALLDAAKSAQDSMAGLADVAAFELGQQQRRGDDAVEHFGFVDGISQPIMTTPDLPASADRTENVPSAGLNLALVKDPFANDADACGSFYVFRKLEQNVRAVRDAEAKLAADLGNISKGLAGAMMVGRFQNGTPVVLANQPQAALARMNNFSYAIDAARPPAFPAKCPFHGHIRKTNPRGDIERQFGGGAATSENERMRRLVRRGITYGARDNDLADEPTGGVGLLFQCYQSSIADQFAFMQEQWVNSVNFVRPAGTGQDTVIGQGVRTTKQKWPDPWGSNTTKTLPDIGQTVFNRGGEFFWAPSMTFLERLRTA